MINPGLYHCAKQGGNLLWQQKACPVSDSVQTCSCVSLGEVHNFCAFEVILVDSLKAFMKWSATILTWWEVFLCDAELTIFLDLCLVTDAGCWAVLPLLLCNPSCSHSVVLFILPPSLSLAAPPHTFLVFSAPITPLKVSHYFMHFFWFCNVALLDWCNTLDFLHLSLSEVIV